MKKHEYAQAMGLCEEAVDNWDNEEPTLYWSDLANMTHPPKPMSLGRKTTILLLLAAAVLTTPWWYLSVTCTLTAWHTIKRYYDQL